jgi:hypothetical protein
MRWSRIAVVGGAILFVMPLVSPARAGGPLPSYTFQMNVAMAMRNFPWLHFHLQGTGQYDPGQTYAVHFTSVPWFFPKQGHDIDLTMLDPAMWSKHFTYDQIAHQPDGQTVYALHAIDDPTLKDATVTVGVHDRARKLDATYNDGTHIQMNVNCSDVNGFLVPASLSANIEEPHLALSANADFKDYAFGE